MLKKFPHEYQMDSKDCGPASLKIISKYYGKYYKLPFLRELCSITKAGVSFHDIGFAAEQIGFRNRCYSLSLQNFFKRIPLPCIVHWKGNHFVVVYKCRKGNVYVSDPAMGLVKYSVKEFGNGWLKGSGEEKKGTLMVLEPTTLFYNNTKARQDKPKTLYKVIDYFLPYRKNFYVLFMVMLIVTLLQALLPFISKAVIDVGIQTNDLDFINIVLIANITIILSMLLGNVIRDWILLHITSRVNISLVSDYLIKLMKLPITFFEDKLVGDILQRANDHERIRSFIMNNSVNLVFASITFLVFSIVLFTFNVTIFWIFILGNLIYVLWILSSLKWRKKFDWENFELNSKNQSYWVETISCVQDIKTNNYEIQRRWEWEAIQARLFMVNQRVLTLDNIQNVGAQFITTLTNLLITFYCAKAVIRGEITFGVMISTQFIIGMLAGPVVQFIIYIQSLNYAKISYQRINEVHDLDDEETIVTNNLELPEFKSLFFNNVSFQYGKNSPLVLKNISLIIPEGCVTAIVGDSGSGKSTLLKLLLRLYQPSYGNIQIGNMNINGINLKQWRAKCGLVLQDGKIFNDTILNNIAVGEDEIDYQKLRNCVIVANIAKEIEELPQGYNTIMGEMGRGMSGGQKQRLLIARALYKDPDYLFLDEATNSLDSINEKKIVEAMNVIFNGKTVVVVAHRLSTIQKAHQIIVLKSGSVVETGNHDVLMKQQSHYYDLVSAQFNI